MLLRWSRVAMTPFAQHLTQKLPAQAHKRVLTTDGYLHLRGLEDDSVYALGDCATIENPNLMEHIMEFFEEADSDKDGSLSLNEFLVICNAMKERFPLTEEHLVNLEHKFRKYDKNHSGTLEIDEMKAMLRDVDSKLTNLPAVSLIDEMNPIYMKFNNLRLYCIYRLPKLQASKANI